MVANLKSPEWRRKWHFQDRDEKGKPIDKKVQDGDLTKWLRNQAKQHWKDRQMKDVTGKTWDEALAMADGFWVAFTVTISGTIEVNAAALGSWLSTSAAEKDPNTPCIVMAYWRRLDAKGKRYNGWGG